MKVCKAVIVSSKTDRLWYAQKIGEVIYVEREPSYHSPNIEGATYRVIKQQGYDLVNYTAFVYPEDIELISMLDIEIEHKLVESNEIRIPKPTKKYKVVYVRAGTNPLIFGVSSSYYESMDDFIEQNQADNIPVYVIPESEITIQTWEQ